MRSVGLGDVARRQQRRGEVVGDDVEVGVVGVVDAEQVGARGVRPL